jgi:hypothetical protein
MVFYKRPPHPRSDIPIDRADIVAGNVFAKLLKIHPAPFELAVVSAHHHVIDEPPRLDFDAPHPAEKISWAAAHERYRLGTRLSAKLRFAIRS